MSCIRGREGHYHLGELLGRGGFACAYRARYVGREGERDVCLKIPICREDVRTVHEEARVLAAIDDVNVVRWVETIELDDGRVALVLELVDGVPLSALMSRRTGGALPTAAAAAEVGARVCRAFLAATRAVPGGVVHRDVCPHNVLVARDGAVKLTDFGVARARDRERWTGRSCIKAKLSYASPEQLLGADLDARSDLFSLGVVLYEFLSGVHPFAGESPRARAHTVLTGPAPAPLSEHGALGEILAQLLERVRGQRAQCSEALAERFERIAGDSGRTELARRVCLRRPGLARARPHAEGVARRNFARFGSTA
ncbi:MAG: serine/threonine-protein kinase [Polyangiaceae bacterium]